MRARTILVALAAVTLASADTLTLRSGRQVQGSYLGGTSRQIRMAVEDRVETFSVSEVTSLVFESGETAAAAPAPAPAPPRQILGTPVQKAPVAAARNEIPAGTEIVIRMIDSVDSEVNTVGQTFKASVDDPVVIDGKTVIPAGADVVTKLVELKEAGRLSGGGKLTLDLVSITAGGKVLEVNSEGVTQAGRSRTAQSGTVIGGTAALGAIIGAIAGGGRGAAIGAASGAGAGTAITVLTSGTRVRIPSETRLTFTLQQPVAL